MPTIQRYSRHNIAIYGALHSAVNCITVATTVTRFGVSMFLRVFYIYLLSLLILACDTSPEQVIDVAQPKADYLLVNAKVYSLDWPEPDIQGKPSAQAPFENGVWSPDADALAIADGKIIGRGKQADLASLLSSKTVLMDLQGATVIPGFIDSHTHIIELGKNLHIADLHGVKNPAEAIARLESFAKDIPEGQWIIGRGWDEGAWADAYPSKELLDKAFPKHPVHLMSLHSFAIWVNSQALTIANINKDTQPPVGGEIVRSDSGEPTGILLNRATTLFADILPKADQVAYETFIIDAMQRMAQDGFVAVHEAGVDQLMMDALISLNEKNLLPLRMYAMLSARDKPLAADWTKRGPYKDQSGFLDVVSVKAYYDGALGSRGARLLEDYSDMEGHRGVSGGEYGFDEEVVADLIAAGFQIGIHAIGDAGNRETLAYFAKHIAKQADVNDRRHRIEHAQIVHPDDFHLFKDLSIIASMEPPHAVEDKTWAEDRLGPDRILGAYAWRTFRENGVPLAFNSDLPGSDHNVFYGLFAAISRQDKDLQPSGGWYPEQVMTIEEALRGYTIWSAYAGFRENDTGTLAVGKWADLTVIDIDPFALARVAPEKILDGNILMTWVNGQPVYRNQKLQ